MALILTTAAVMGLAGCSGQTDKTETTAAPAKTTAEPATQAKAETTEASTEDKKRRLFRKDHIIYFPAGGRCTEADRWL